MTTLVDHAPGPVDRNAGVPTGPASGPVDRNAGVPTGPAWGIGQGLEAG